ncbi:MAG: hypothetical protein K8L99_20785 [Anaerolineae bacterium]|nr:hypothetical protein [Anaerolineae bacterium]
MQIEPIFVMQGQEVHAHPYANTLEPEVIEAVAAGVQADYQALAQEKIAPLRCPEHHQAATFTVLNILYVEDEEVFEGDYDIDTCCPEFQKMVAEQLHIQ